MVRNAPKRFSEKILVLEIWALRSQNGPKWPKMGLATGLFPYYQKTALRIFLIFGMKLGDDIWRKMTETDFSRKFRFSGIRARRPVLGPKNWNFQNIGMWPLVGCRIAPELRKKYFRVILPFLGRKIGQKG